MEFESAQLVPGLGKECNSCTSWLPGNPPDKIPGCKAKTIEKGIQTYPRIRDNACENYQPNLPTSLRNNVRRIRLAIYDIGPKIPIY